jgi:hypothetical protein
LDRMGGIRRMEGRAVRALGGFLGRPESRTLRMRRVVALTMMLLTFGWMLRAGILATVHGLPIGHVLSPQDHVHYAAYQGDTLTVVKLLRLGTDADTLAGYSLTTPLMAAALRGQVETVELLLDRGAGIDRQNLHGKTALYLAAQNGHAPVVRLLLERGADPRISTVNGETPLSYAAGRGDTAVVALLQNAGAR